jgi:hypothetical protein
MIFEIFDPEIRFIWIVPEDHRIQKKRLDERSAKFGNPITSEVYDYMLAFWEPPLLPHDVLVNGSKLEKTMRSLLRDWGLCMSWKE